MAGTRAPQGGTAAHLGYEGQFWQTTCGQESNYTTWRLARMNLAIRGIDSGQIAQGIH